MATTTPNYGWPVPTSADYVAQGADAIKDLGDAIDATVFGLPAPASGLTLINTTTFSAVSSQSVNNVFTSAYANYKIDLTITAKSANSAVDLRYRAGGVDNSTSNYYYGATVARSTSSIDANGGNGISSFVMLYSNVSQCGGTYQIYSPQLANNTLATYQGMGGDVSTYFSFTGACQFIANTVFDGFSVSAASGTITGTIRVYGIGI
jgi:hypothetical protein